MQKQKQQDEEISLTNTYSLFVYAIRTQITRDYYLRRLRTFFDFIKILPNAEIERRCNHFAALAIKDPKWALVPSLIFYNIKRNEWKERKLQQQPSTTW